MRATTAFNKMLAIPGAYVVGVTFTPSGVVVDLRRRTRRVVCPCGWSGRAVYDRSVRHWRALDLGAVRLVLRAEIRRLDCRRCGRVRTETVPWARPSARFTRDFEDVVAWLAQRMDKTAITRLLRCSWEAVAGIVARVVAEHIDDARLDEVYRIGVDEVSYRKGHRYLTVVADHDRDGAVIWVGEGKSGATLDQFFNQLGPLRSTRIEAASADLHGGYARVIAKRAPQARICADPFHVIKIANLAVDEVRRSAWNAARSAGRVTRVSPLWRTRQNPDAQLIKHTRWALLKDPQTWTEHQRSQLTQLRKARHVLFRAWVLKEELRDLYQLPPGRRPDAHLDGWLARASRSRIPAVVDLSRTIRKHREHILAAVDLRLSNSKLEGLNSKIRLINHRGYGHHTPAAVIAMIYLCCSGLTIGVVGVIIGVDPHKGSHTAVVLDEVENKLGQLRVRATPGQVDQLLRWAGTWPQRTWAIEGARGLGQLLAQQLLGAGERVLDVQPKLAARVRLLNTGQVNKNDPNDARSVAVAALRASDLREVVVEGDTAVMKLWARRYRDLGSARTQLVCRLHAVLCELVPGGFAREISAAQAIQVLDDITTHGSVAGARLELARDLVEDLQRIDERRREIKRRLTRTVSASKTTVTEIHGVGPIVAATVLGYVRDIHRFPTRDHFAAYNGTAPIDVSSGNRKIQRLSRRGNRQLNQPSTWPP